MPKLIAHLGSAKAPQPPNSEEKYSLLVKERNPYTPGVPLPSAAPLFMGRRQDINEIYGKLRRPEKPGCISVLGERRMGKTSLLNQLVGLLACEENLVTISGTAQDWGAIKKADLFMAVHQAIGSALGVPVDKPAKKYSGLRNAVEQWAGQGYRFVLVVDEFESLTANKELDGEFFGHLRSLGESPAYGFGFLLASRRPLDELCREHRVESSSFWNIFGFPYVLGLLAEQEASDLITIPMQYTLGDSPMGETDAVLELTGNHPALIHMVMDAVWYSVHGNYLIDKERIDNGLNVYYRDLLAPHHRTPEELEVLLASISGKSPPDSPIRDHLQQRGLLTVEGSPFSPAFGQVLRDLAGDRKWSLDTLLDGLDRFLGTNQKRLTKVAKIFGVGKKIGKIIGRVLKWVLGD